MMPIHFEPGDFRISVQDPDGNEVHYIAVNAVWTKDPTERVMAAARGAVGFARDQGYTVEKYVVYDRGREEVVLEQGV
jgi:hypothetical protein